MKAVIYCAVGAGYVLVGQEVKEECQGGGGTVLFFAVMGSGETYHIVKEVQYLFCSSGRRCEGIRRPFFAGEARDEQSVPG